MKLDWVEVTSSNIQALEHHGTELHVRFHNGAVYKYDGVPKSVYDSILTAASVGQKFNQLVKGHYNYTRIA